jgi:sortase B
MPEQKRKTGRDKKKHRGSWILPAALVVVFCLSAGMLYYDLVYLPGQTRQQIEQLKEDFPGENLPEEPAGEKGIQPLVDLAALQEQYPDIQGWISIPGTGIDYPVLQSSATEPEYYLRRNYKGEPDINGSIFLQWDCDILNGENLVLYGHHMKSGAMFGNLDKYAASDYCAEHPTVLLQTVDGVSSYAVAAVLKADVSMFPFQQTVFPEPDGLLDYVSQAKAMQLFENGETAPHGTGQVLTLVTCSYEWKNARTIVVAVRE